MKYKVDYFKFISIILIFSIFLYTFIYFLPNFLINNPINAFSNDLSGNPQNNQLNNMLTGKVTDKTSSQTITNTLNQNTPQHSSLSLITKDEVKNILSQNPKINNYDKEIYSLCINKHQSIGDCAYIIKTIIALTSEGNPQYEKTDNGITVYGLIPMSEKESGLKKDDLLNPKKNIEAAVNRIMKLYTAYNEDLSLTVIGYFGGRRLSNEIMYGLQAKHEDLDKESKMTFEQMLRYVDDAYKILNTGRQANIFKYKEKDNIKSFYVNFFTAFEVISGKTFSGSKLKDVLYNHGTYSIRPSFSVYLNYNISDVVLIEKTITDFLKKAQSIKDQSQSSVDKYSFENLMNYLRQKTSSFEEVVDSKTGLKHYKAYGLEWYGGECGALDEVLLDFSKKFIECIESSSSCYCDFSSVKLPYTNEGFFGSGIYKTSDLKIVVRVYYDNRTNTTKINFQLVDSDKNYNIISTLEKTLEFPFVFVLSDKFVSTSILSSRVKISEIDLKKTRDNVLFHNNKKIKKTVFVFSRTRQSSEWECGIVEDGDELDDVDLEEFENTLVKAKTRNYRAFLFDDDIKDDFDESLSPKCLTSSQSNKIERICVQNPKFSIINPLSGQPENVEYKFAFKTSSSGVYFDWYKFYDRFGEEYSAPSVVSMAVGWAKGLDVKVNVIRDLIGKIRMSSEQYYNTLKSVLANYYHIKYKEIDSSVSAISSVYKPFLENDGLGVSNFENYYISTSEPEPTKDGWDDIIRDSNLELKYKKIPLEFRRYINSQEAYFIVFDPYRSKSDYKYKNGDAAGRGRLISQSDLEKALSDDYKPLVISKQRNGLTQETSENINKESEFLRKESIVIVNLDMSKVSSANPISTSDSNIELNEGSDSELENNEAIWKRLRIGKHYKKSGKHYVIIAGYIPSMPSLAQSSIDYNSDNIIIDNLIRQKWHMGFKRPAPPNTIVIHGTGGGATYGSVYNFVLGGYERSSNYLKAIGLFHYLIERDGKITEIIDPSRWVHHSNSNDRRTIGIEHVNVARDNSAPYTQQQYDASIQLIFDVLMKNYDIHTIISHNKAWELYSGGSKECPGKGFDWNQLKQALDDKGYIYEYDDERFYNIEPGLFT